jgi:pimeloyl-ACP methyl ester carboxylesterase
MVQAMTALAVNGWLQRNAAIDFLYPKLCVADYVGLNPDRFFETLTPNPTLAIGWSLGAAVLLEAVGQAKLKTDYLILIAAPYRAPEFNDFAARYQAAPQQAARKFERLLHYGNRDHAQTVETTFLQPQKQDWQPWLTYLQQVDFSHTMWPLMPKTLFIHGRHDAIISYGNLGHWRQIFPKAEYCTAEDSGHAPHLHRPEAIRGIIHEFVHG